MPGSLQAWWLAAQDSEGPEREPACANGSSSGGQSEEPQKSRIRKLREKIPFFPGAGGQDRSSSNGRSAETRARASSSGRTMYRRKSDEGNPPSFEGNVSNQDLITPLFRSGSSTPTSMSRSGSNTPTSMPKCTGMRQFGIRQPVWEQERDWSRRVSH